MTNICHICKYYSADANFCAVNPTQEGNCPDYQSTISLRLVEAVISGVILSEYESCRGGKYKITEILNVTYGARNCSDGYHEHVKEMGGPHSNNSFYGGYDSPEEAAVHIIKHRGIIAVDAHGRVVTKKKS